MTHNGTTGGEKKVENTAKKEIEEQAKLVEELRQEWHRQAGVYQTLRYGGPEYRIAKAEAQKAREKYDSEKNKLNQMILKGN